MSGQRYHPDWTRVGGVMKELPDEETFKTMVKNFIRGDLDQALKDIDGLLSRNRIFIDRTQGVGVLTHDEAIQWGSTGPIARASGVRRDVRKDEPYLCFADNWDGEGAEAVKFSVPLANEGDVYARFRVRLEEARQSIKIIEQLIEDLPQGPIDVFADSKMTKPRKEDVYGSIEGLIQHFELIMSNRGWEPPVAESYGCCETANGELGYFIVSDGSPRSWRVKTRAPSFLNYQLMPKLIEGHMLADVVAVLGSLNIVAAELDR
ncbi:MAG: hypothetical protein AAF235_04455 [Planctomycetota bacterium]